MSRRVLIIAYHYPPVRGSSGIQRTLKFSAYLRDMGWEPMILTVTLGAYEQIGNDQMAEIPAGMVLERAFALNTAEHLAIRGRYLRWMAQPDRWVTWWPVGVWRGMQMIRRYRPAVIMSTYPIASAHLIGLTLQRLSGLPWLADCRDSMTEPGYPTHPMTWQTNRWLEQAMVRRSAKVVFTTPGTLAMYATRYPQVPPSRWAVIENGFDEENFQSAQSAAMTSPADVPSRITLLHSGVLYPQERDPRPFFAALRQLKSRQVFAADRLRIVLRATGSEADYRTMIAQHDIADLVELAPPISYREALQEMLSADGLLIFQAAMCNHQIPAKLYEYMRSGRPIFALTDPEGDTAGALRAVGISEIVDISNESDIVVGLTSFLSKLERQGGSGVAPEIARLHSRRARTAELARLLNQIAQRT
jgi:glycosyltransferase involved in cell wall biosynthesis